MLRKPDFPLLPGVPAPGSDTGLAVKDTLREVRFNVKHGARKLVDAVEAATQRHDEVGPSPLALLGEPLRLAMRKTAALLSNVDHAAVDLLSADGLYRAMTVPLVPSASYFARPAADDALQRFTTDHHWRYRHWLTMKQYDDVFVHERAIAAAGSRVADRLPTLSTLPRDRDSEAELHRRTTVPIVQALQQQAVLAAPALTAGGRSAELAELNALGAIAVVLAGEIAPRLGGRGLRELYVEALQLADEIALADRAGWGTALRGHAPDEALGRWFAFVARHV